jgi:hypothetical protein
MGGLFGTAAGQCDASSPEQFAECENPSLNPFESVMENMYNLVYSSSLYLGMVCVVGGLILWLSVDSNKDRSQMGMWLFVSGNLLIIFYFGYSTIVSLLKYIAIGI